MQSLRLRSQLVTWFFALHVLVSIAAAISDASIAQFLQGMTPGDPGNAARATAHDDRQSLIGIVEIGVSLACAVVFLMWFQRAYKNLHTVRYQPLEFTPGWAIGGFFVPFINFVRPYRIMKEICAGSTSLAEEPERRAEALTSLLIQVRWWWMLFLSDSAISNAAARTMMKAEALDEILTAEWIDFGSELLSIPAAIVALLLVRRVTEVQERARLRAEVHS
jgi:hypothetical protein